MARFLIAMYLMALLVVPAAAQPDVSMMAPSVVEVAGVNPDEGTIEFAVSMTVPKTKDAQIQRVVIVDGQQKTVTETRKVMVYESMLKSVKWPIKGNQAFDGEGKKLEGDAFWKRIKKGDMVMKFVGTQVDPRWFKVLKPDAIVLLGATPTGAPLPKIPIPPPPPPPPPK